MTDDLLVWVDIETTGLSYTLDRLLEVAIVVTDKNLTMIDNFSQVISYNLGEPAISNVDPVVIEMHTKNGLWEECKDYGLPVGEVQDNALDFINHYISMDVKPEMCGSSIHFDRNFLRVRMAALEARFHYRNLDVSSIKMLVREWFPDVYEAREADKEKEHTIKAHRGIEDIYDSIYEFNFYLTHLKGLNDEAVEVREVQDDRPPVG